MRRRPFCIHRHQIIAQMNRQQLIANIRRKRSFLCVGLDTDLKKIPAHLLEDEDPIFAFNKAIIDATAPTVWPTSPTLLSTSASA